MMDYLPIVILTGIFMLVFYEMYLVVRLGVRLYWLGWRYTTEEVIGDAKIRTWTVRFVLVWLVMALGMGLIFLMASE